MTNPQVSDAIEAMARAAYIAHHKNGPSEEAFEEPNMGRGGFKTEVVVWRSVAQAALAALEASGWAVVPVEATVGMIDRGFHASDPLPGETATAFVARTYRAMIAARPRVEG